MNKLIVFIKKVDATRSEGATGLYRCYCGKEFTTRKRNVESGRTKSCGCYLKNNPGGLKHGLRYSPEYVAWNDMKQRCLNKKKKNYKDYGGRGIKICKQWLSFDCFYRDMGARPSPNHSLDRINNNGNYDPNNCRWATKKEQNRNTRGNIWIEINGEYKLKTEWLKIYSLDPKSYSYRISKGLTPQQAITTPKTTRWNGLFDQLKMNQIN